MIEKLTDEQLETRMAMMEAMIAHAHPKNLPSYTTIYQKLLNEQVRRDLLKEEQSHA